MRGVREGRKKRAREIRMHLKASGEQQAEVGK